MPGDKKYTSNRLSKLTYTVCLIAAGLALFTSFVCFFLGVNKLAYYHLITLFIYIYCAYISKKGNIFYSRIIFFILLNISITLSASFAGKDGSVEYLFIYSLALPFSAFSFRNEKKFVYIFSWLSGILWITLSITDFKLFTSTPINPEIAHKYIYPISMVSTFILVYTQLTYFSILGVKYYAKIRNKKQEAIDASLAKSKFLSTMSHEIRTPLNAVIGLSHILGDNKPREDQIENIEALNFSGKSLLSLLNNVLDFSKMQSTKIELDNIPTNILAAIEQIKKIHEPACLRKNISFNLEIDRDIPYVWLDIVRFNQVLNNLISNAIKFTDRGNITLIINKISQQEDNVDLYIEVKDTGIGIPKNKQETIWNAFAQASTSTNRIYGGTGLGLPIVKSIIEAMKSKVIIASNKKGSSFYFKISLKIASNEDIGIISDKKEHDFNGKKALLVDDNLINVMVGKQILEKSNLKVDVANDGLAAFNKVKENEYDLVLMDIQMPVMDGYEATVEIRKINKTLPVLALSANVFIEIKDKIEACGMNGFIVKPFNPDDLLNQIEKFLSN